MTPRASAGPLLELLGAPTGNGGFTARAGSPSPYSTYFNPALLPAADESLEGGAFFLIERIDIELMSRPAGADVPEGIADYVQNDAGHSSPALHPLPTKWLDDGHAAESFAPRPRGASNGGQQTRSYVTAGLVKRVFADRFVLGLCTMFPTSSFTGATAFYNDEREQYFSNSLHPELYGDRLSVASLAFGAGSRIARNLSLGVSVSLALSNDATAKTYVPSASDLSETDVDLKFNAKAGLAPHVGLSYALFERLSLSATFHGVEGLDMRSRFANLLSTGRNQDAEMRFTFGYVPWRVSLGSQVALVGSAASLRELNLVASAVFAHWRGYRDRHAEHPDRAYEWRDTVTPALGLKARHGRTRSFVDFTAVPTPIPEQRGRSNYVDNNRLGLSLGVEHGFTLWGAAFSIGANAQAHQLLARRNVKTPAPAGSADKYPQLVVDEVPDDLRDARNGYAPAAGREGLQTNNPGWPGYTSSGFVLGTGLHLASRW